MDFNFTPQATKGFGANNSSGNATSGSTTHTEVFFYEANINYQLANSLSLKLGKQELAYGDHMLVGSLPWANTARSFDGLKFKWNVGPGWIDLLYSKISDNSTTDSPKDDSDFLVLYNSFNINSLFNPIEFYVMHLDDDRTSNTEVNTIGFRLKGAHGPLFYRTENTVQNGANVGDDAFQYNLEAGAKASMFLGSLEYSVAGHDFRQLFPTAHKFFGFADVLGRRNLKHWAAHLKASPWKWLTVRAGYHSFQRNDTTKSAYKLNGSTPWGTTGTSDDIGSEVDIVLIFKTKDKVKFQVGGAWFSPGTYMRQQDTQNRSETNQFVYGQLNAMF